MQRMRKVLLVLAIGMPATAVGAEEIKISGTIEYRMTPMSDADAAQMDKASRQQLSGWIMADDESSLVHKSRQNCFGTFAVDESNAPFGHGYCDAVDKDGHVWWLTFVAGAEAADWTVVGGSGKYSSMTGSGTTSFKSDAQSMQAATGWKQFFRGTLNILDK